MRKALLIAFVAGGALSAQGPHGGRTEFGGPPMGIAGTRGMVHNAAITGMPFSAVQVTSHVYTMAGGNTIQWQEQTNLFRDSQGRMRAETTRTQVNGQDGRTTVTITDPVAQVVRRLNPQNKTATEAAMRQPQFRPGASNVSRQRIGGSAGVLREDLGTQTVNGVAAAGTRVTRTILAGAIGNTQAIPVVRETWVAADLQVPVLIKTSDPRFGTTVAQLTNIVRSEPDGSLFQIPADYTLTARHGGGTRAPQEQ